MPPTAPGPSPPGFPHKPVTDSRFETAGGRLLLHYPLQQPASHDRSERSGVHIEPGTLQTVTITAVHMDHLEVATDSGEKQRWLFCIMRRYPVAALLWGGHVDACDASFEALDLGPYAEYFCMAGLHRPGRPMQKLLQ